MAGMLISKNARKESMVAMLTILLSSEYIFASLLWIGMMMLFSNPFSTIIIEASTKITHRYFV